jgi:hypothetical protein
VSVAYNNRAFVVGFTGSGKSELLNHLFSSVQVQRLLVDTKDEFSIPGIAPVAGDPGAIDWHAPTIHYIARMSGPDEFDELFEACFRRRRLVVCVHELADLCGYQPNRTPEYVNRYITQGRAHGLGLFGGTQRPRRMPVSALSEAEHVFAFVPRLQGDDHDTLAHMVGEDRQRLGGDLDELQTSSGHHSFVHFNRLARDSRAWPPLPDQLRARTIVGRRTIA